MDDSALRASCLRESYPKSCRKSEMCLPRVPMRLTGKAFNTIYDILSSQAPREAEIENATALYCL